MGAKQNKCCCGAGCVICEDNFDRVDNDNLGSLWVEKSGDFDISSNTIITATPGIVLTSCRQSKPYNTTYNYIVQVNLVDTASTWNIICKYIDATNFDWLEVYTSGTDILPRFWRRTGGSDALVMDITTHPAGVPLSSSMPSQLPISMCYSEGGWMVSGQGESTWTTCDATPATSLPADTTVGFVGFMDGDFDEWQYDYHKLSNMPCDQCDCYCVDPTDTTDFKCIPELLTLTLTPTTAHPDCTSSPITITYTLRQSLPIENDPAPPTYTLHPEKHFWFSDPVGVWEPVLGNIPFWFRLECRGNGEFELVMFEYPGQTSTFAASIVDFDGATGPNGGRLNTDATCNPIIITFPSMTKLTLQVGSPGPFSCDPFQGLIYSVVVTE